MNTGAGQHWPVVPRAVNGLILDVLFGRHYIDALTRSGNTHDGFSYPDCRLTGPKRWVMGLPLTFTGLTGLYILALFNHLFYTVTSFGYWPVVASGTVALSGWLWYRKQGSLILPLAISLVSCELLTFLGKLAFHRPRPDGGVLDPSGFSFPSGHASISVAFYGFAIYCRRRHSQSAY